MVKRSESLLRLSMKAGEGQQAKQEDMFYLLHSWQN
jgi:hypothetical protein